MSAAQEPLQEQRHLQRVRHKVQLHVHERLRGPPLRVQHQRLCGGHLSEWRPMRGPDQRLQMPLPEHVLRRSLRVQESSAANERERLEVVFVFCHLHHMSDVCVLLGARRHAIRVQDRAGGHVRAEASAAEEKADQKDHGRPEGQEEAKALQEVDQIGWASESAAQRSVHYQAGEDISDIL